MNLNIIRFHTGLEGHTELQFVLTKSLAKIIYMFLTPNCVQQIPFPTCTLTLRLPRHYPEKVYNPYHCDQIDSRLYIASSLVQSLGNIQFRLSE